MMPDRENVISHLQIIHTWAKLAHERDLQFFTPKHLENIAEWTDDAIALLKDQVPKPVDEHGRMFTVRYGSCPNCLKPIDSDVNPKACGHCGQAVKWG